MAKLQNCEKSDLEVCWNRTIEYDVNRDQEPLQEKDVIHNHNTRESSVCSIKHLLYFSLQLTVSSVLPKVLDNEDPIANQTSNTEQIEKR